MFQDADADGSGFLDKDEVRRMLIKNAGIEYLDEHLVESYFSRADSNQDGRIDHVEFMRLVEGEVGILDKVVPTHAQPLYYQQGIPAKQFAILYETFMDADVDCNGCLDKAEVRRLLEKRAKSEGSQGQVLTDTDVEAYLLKADTNNDGKINLKEFMNSIRKSTETSP
jgi:Ca2+-binding EF-hand superfamily protein